MQADIDLGISDGRAVTSMSKTHTEDLLHFFGLKKQLDPRVRGITFDQFVQMKYEEGAFEHAYDPRNDESVKAMFLQ